jgi:hypothetical protein
MACAYLAVYEGLRDGAVPALPHPNGLEQERLVSAL